MVASSERARPSQAAASFGSAVTASENCAVAPRGSVASSFSPATRRSEAFALPGRWIYPASKAAIEQVTRSQAMDLAPFNIRANSVMPGWTAKPWQETAPQETKDAYAHWSNKLHMLGRLGEGRDAFLGGHSAVRPHT